MSTYPADPNDREALNRAAKVAEQHREIAARIVIEFASKQAFASNAKAEWIGEFLGTVYGKLLESIRKAN